eukprot:gene11253-23539_t
MLNDESVSIPTTLLSHTWLPVCVSAIATYTFLQALIQCDILYSHSPLCHNEKVPTFVWLMHCLSAMSFLIKVMLMFLKCIAVGRKIRRSSIDLTSIFGISFTTSFIAGTSSFLAAGWNWGGICEDRFGGNHVGTGDYEEATHVNIRAHEQFRRRRSLYLALSMTLFPIIYYLSLFHVINRYETIFAFTFLNLFVKLVLITLVMECRIELLYEDVQTKQDQANQSRQAFLRYIMHEVRVPLSSISMGIDALSSLEEGCSNSNIDNNNEIEMGKDSPASEVEQKASEETLFMMREAVSFMSDTLNSILNMQKIEEGKLNLVYSKFIIKDLIRKVCCTLRGALSSKLISLQVNVADSVAPFLIGDSFQIEHVLANFISNAIKFSPTGSCIYIGVTNSTQGNGYAAFMKSPRKIGQIIDADVDYIVVKFTVRDEGVGISEEDQRKLFKPFSQIRPGELQGGGGSGVGLSICKQIIELHGGTVGCTSAPDEGSVFYFILPLAIGNEDDNDDEENVNAVSEVKPSLVHPNPHPHPSTGQQQNPMTSSESQVTSHRTTLPLGCSSVNTIAVCGDTATRLASAHSSSTPSNNYNNNYKNSSKNNNSDSNSNKTMANDDEVAFSIVINSLKTGDSKDEINSERDGDSDIESVLSDRRRGVFRQKKSSSKSMGRKLLYQTQSTSGINVNDLRVLVVDDVHSNRKLLTLLLRKKHVDCSEVGDGADAVSFVKANPDLCDMIFMDNMMPRMTGIVATHCIRGLGFNKLIVGLTGNAMDDDVNEFLAAGVDVVFTKPMKIQQLHMLFAYINTNGNGTVGEQKLRIVGNRLKEKFFFKYRPVIKQEQR